MARTRASRASRCVWCAGPWLGRRDARSSPDAGNARRVRRRHVVRRRARERPKEGSRRARVPEWRCSFSRCLHALFVRLLYAKAPTARRSQDPRRVRLSAQDDEAMHRLEPHARERSKRRVIRFDHERDEPFETGLRAIFAQHGREIPGMDVSAPPIRQRYGLEVVYPAVGKVVAQSRMKFGRMPRVEAVAHKLVAGKHSNAAISARCRYGQKARIKVVDRIGGMPRDLGGPELATKELRSRRGLLEGCRR